MAQTVDDAIAAWWDEDAERINAMAAMAREFAVRVPRPTKKEEGRAFCPTGDGGGINNSCGSGFSSVPAASELSRVSSLGGSTGAILSEDDAGNRYVVKAGNSPDHIRSEAAANSMYKAAGVPVPQTRLDDTDPKSPKQISLYVKAKPLAAVSGPAREKAIREIQKGFAADALLANWDVVGLEEDNILVPDAGPPVRVDNGGSLMFRAMGKEKAFGPVVGELESLRESEQGEPIFGTLTDSQVAGQIDDLVGRKDKILSAAPPAIRDVISQRLDYMEQWAAKKKAAKESRAFCPTGDGGGIDNSCAAGESVPDSSESSFKEASPASRPPEDAAQSQEWFGTAKDSSATKSTVQSKAGPVDVVVREDVTNRTYLDEIEVHGESMGMGVDFETAVALQADTDIDEDSGPFQVYVNSGYGYFTGFYSSLADVSDIDSYGYDYGTIDDDAASEMINEKIDQAWDELDKQKEFGDGWDSLTEDEQQEKQDEWRDSAWSDVSDEVEQIRQEQRDAAIEQMKQELERGLASASIDCCLQLYRGLKLTPTDVDRIIQDGYITHSGTNSWTTSRDVAQAFGASRALLVLRRPKVGHVNKGNAHSESEVIRPPSKMRIAGVVKTQSGTVFYVDEDDDYKD